MIYPPSWLPVACLTLVLFASAARGVRLRTLGVRVYGFDHDASLQSIAERFWKVAVGLLATAMAVSWIAPELEVHLGHPAWSAAPALRWLATGVITSATALILAAQAAMGSSWRVGVPIEGPGALVTGGPFAFSRNPVFVGMFGMVLGAFFWSPSMLTAALLPLAAFAMAIQVRIEEGALSAKHGDAFAAYKARTPRWIWPIG